jgi:predicted RNA-binding protein with PIN domain
VRRIVDGNNVMGSRPDGWWRDRAGAMARLVTGLGPLAAEEGAPIRVIFDGRPREMPDVEGVEVGWAERSGPNAADDAIARLVAQDADPATLLVTTSDRDLVRRVREAGGQVEGAGALLGRLDR